MRFSLFAPDVAAAHHFVDCRRGWIVIVSLGCSANFTFQIGSAGETKEVKVESGDVLFFPTDSKSAVFHGVKSIADTAVPSHLQKSWLSGSRLSLQFRQSLRKEPLGAGQAAESILGEGTEQKNKKVPDIPGSREQNVCLALQPWATHRELPAITPCGVDVPQDIVMALVDVLVSHHFQTAMLLSTCSRQFYAALSFGFVALFLILILLFRVSYQPNKRLILARRRRRQLLLRLSGTKPARRTQTSTAFWSLGCSLRRRSSMYVLYTASNIMRMDTQSSPTRLCAFAAQLHSRQAAQVTMLLAPSFLPLSAVTKPHPGQSALDFRRESFVMTRFWGGQTSTLVCSFAARCFS